MYKSSGSFNGIQNPISQPSRMDIQDIISFLIITILTLIILLLIYMVIKRQKQLDIYRHQKLKTDVLLNTFLNQLDLHTIFNFLNIIGASLYKSTKDESYQMVTDFGRMLRGNLTFNKGLFKPLNEEVEMLQNYIQLEKARFEQKFDFEYFIEDQELNSKTVPRMLMYVFIENAIKHGIKNYSQKGKIKLLVRRVGEKVEICIQDNGIGRQKAIEIGSKSNNYGRKIVDAYVKLFNTGKQNNLLIVTTDLLPLQENTGTQVVITWDPTCLTKINQN
jgi:LytS/YehU family sensor histidine kinase